MFGSSIIDVAIGIVFVFLLMSLIASTVNEIILSFLNMRGKELLRGIQTLLNDGEANKLVIEADGLVKDVYNHGHIYGLFRGEFDGKNNAGQLPSYIPSRNFALALLDVVPKKAAAQKLRGAIGELKDPDISRTLTGLLPNPASGLAPAQGTQAPLAKPVGQVIRDVRDAASSAKSSPNLAPADKDKIDEIINIADVALGENLSAGLKDKFKAVADAAKALPAGAGAALASIADTVTATNVADVLQKLKDAATKMNETAPHLALLVDAAKSEADPVQALREAALAIDAKVGQPLIAILNEVSGEGKKLTDEVEAWYNSAMDRVSGWYKYKTQTVLFVLGIILAVVLNANTITITQALSKSATMRQSIVAAAQQFANKNTGPGTQQTGNGNESGGNQTGAGTSASQKLDDQIKAVHDQVNSLEGLGLPLGWSHTWHPAYSWTWTSLLEWLGVVAGWLITAFAVSLGAPFWFDLLNKFMVVRSTVKPREKSPEEPSKS